MERRKISLFFNTVEPWKYRSDMKTVVFLAFLFVAIIVAMVTAALFDDNTRGSRQKRVPCFFLSGLGWDDTPCTAYCPQTSKPRGYCNNGVCVCRERLGDANENGHNFGSPHGSHIE